MKNKFITILNTTINNSFKLKVTSKKKKIGIIVLLIYLIFCFMYTFKINLSTIFETLKSLNLTSYFLSVIVFLSSLFSFCMTFFLAKNILFQNKLGFSFLWHSLNRKTKKELIQRLIANLEITRDKNYNIKIKNIKFTDEFISKSNKEYLNYLNEILNNNEIGIKYKEQINKQELEKIEQDYFIFSTKKYEDNKYSEADLLLYMELIKQHFYQDGIINCPYIEDNNIVDNLLLIPKTIINI